MRDIYRIEPFLKELKKLWEFHQDLRFGQIVAIISAKYSNTDLFYIEDEDFLKYIEKYNKEKNV
jgi:hypothetical protein